MSDRSPAGRFGRGGMDAERDRRNGANWLDERMIGPGLELRDGRIQVKVARKTFIRLNRSGEVEGVANEPFFVEPGSPYGLAVRLGPNVSVQEGAIVAPMTSEVAVSQKRQSRTGLTADTTVVTMAPAPRETIYFAPGDVRVRNADSASATITVKVAGTDGITLHTETLAAGADWVSDFGFGVRATQSLTVELGGTVTTQQAEWSATWVEERV